MAAMSHFSPNLPNSSKMKVSVSSRHGAGNGKMWFPGLYLSLLCVSPGWPPPSTRYLANWKMWEETILLQRT